jgi:uncharacterized protein (DUF433 family)
MAQTAPEIPLSAEFRMSLMVAPEKAPLNPDADGVVRVGGTRVTLDTLVAAFRDGVSAEGIVEQYPTLQLGDVYSAIGYILHHPVEINAYLERRQAQSDEVQRENDRRFSPVGVRDRLLARRHSG